MLDGPTSYHAWSQNMIVFLKGHKLWRYVIGSIPKPVPNPKSKATVAEESSKTVVTTDDYEEHLEEWESIQSKILLWFINTSIPSIHNLLPQSLPFLLIFSFLSILNLWRILQHRLPLQTTHLRFCLRHMTRLSWILWHHPLLSLLLVLNFVVPLG